MHEKLTHQSNTILGRMLNPSLPVSLFSLLLISGCGTKEESKDVVKHPMGSNSMSSQITEDFIGFFEEDLPGSPLLSAHSSNASFQIMAQNLSGSGTVSLTEQKSFDYTVIPGQRNGAPLNLIRQEGRLTHNSTAQLKVRGHIDSRFGRLSLIFEGAPSEAAKTFIYQHQINIFGITLSSTDRIAIFKATDPTPHSIDFLKVSYTTKNPMIQRFKISQLKPFPVLTHGSSIPRNSEKANWINVISQKLKTFFQYATK